MTFRLALTALALTAAPLCAQTVHTGNTQITGDLIVQENSTLFGNIYVHGTGGIGSTLDVTGRLRAAGNSFVTDGTDTLIDSTLDVTGRTRLTGDTCIGASCSSPNVWPSATLLLRSDNPGLAFDDTSASPYPDRDWRIRINDSFSGGAEYFAIFDDYTANTPFRLEGGAPDAALWVASDGDVGLGTSVPQSDLHVVSSGLATLRLEQSGQRSWLMAAGGTGYYLFDATNARQPFWVETGSPTAALVVEETGRIGIGTSSPQKGVHVRSGSGDGAMLIEETSAGNLGQLTLRNNGVTYFTLEDSSIAPGDHTGRAWNFQNNKGTFRVTTAPGGPGEIEMRLNAAGDLFLKGQLYTGTGGATTTCASGCDRVFDADYKLPPIAEHQATMMALKHLPAVGPTPENGPFNLSRITGGMLNELEKAHLYIGQLHGQSDQQAGQIEALMAQVGDLARLVRDQQDQMATLRAELSALRN